jgi:vacuolar iron transporter family protein
MKNLRHAISSYIREIIFGLEDALVSTLGAITGIAVGAGSTYIVILAGLVLIVAESTSMAAGSYLSTKAAVSVMHNDNKRKHIKDAEHENPIFAGAVMWVFYFLGGFIPLAPYFFLNVFDAIWPSIFLTAISLFLLGVWSASYTKRGKAKSGVEMVVISLAAALIGFVIGRLVSNYFGVEVL